MAENANPRERLLKARTLLKTALGGAYEAIESEAATAGTVAMALAALSQAHQAWNDAIVAIPIDAMIGGDAGLVIPGNRFDPPLKESGRTRSSLSKRNVLAWWLAIA